MYTSSWLSVKILAVHMRKTTRFSPTLHCLCAGEPTSAYVPWLYLIPRPSLAPILDKKAGEIDSLHMVRHTEGSAWLF